MVSEKYRELTGLRSSGYTRAPAGAFFEYGYYQFGVPSFFPQTWMYNADSSGTNRMFVSAQPAIASADLTGPAEPVGASGITYAPSKALLSVPLLVAAYGM